MNCPAAGVFFDDTQGALEQRLENNQRINDNNRMIVDADKKLRAAQLEVLMVFSIYAASAKEIFLRWIHFLPGNRL